MITPTDTARLTLDAMQAQLNQLRTALADAYGRTGNALTDAGRKVEQAEAEARRWQDACTERISRHNDYRRRLAAVLAMPENTTFNQLIEYAARTLTRSGERLLAAEERTKELSLLHQKACRALDLMQHDRDAHRARAEQAERVARSAAKDTADAIRRADQAERRAETASVLGARYMGDAERYHAAWHSARLRAQLNASRLRTVQASRRRWKNRAETAAAEALAAKHSRSTTRVLGWADDLWEQQEKKIAAAEQRLSTIRQYLDAAYADDIASGVRDDLALILDGQPATYAPATED
ncbi:hypothetical protein [Streptomyces nitrosporeus]|uniref:hypothetical protein n=1 Tax=Streptomyces nitrosporeus TaxID=28894 RepID=UPI0039A07535